MRVQRYKKCGKQQSRGCCHGFVRFAENVSGALFNGYFGSGGTNFDDVDAVAQLTVLLGNVHAVDGVDATLLGTVDAAVIGVDVRHLDILESGGAAFYLVICYRFQTKINKVKEKENK